MRLTRWLTSPVWQVRERLKYDSAKWRCARRAAIAWERIDMERKTVHDSWIQWERMAPADPQIPILKGKDEALSWVMSLLENN
jgi:hypothetical protein